MENDSARTIAAGDARFRCAAPKGAVDGERSMASLKRCPDAKLPRVGFINAFQLGRRVPEGLKPAFFQALNDTAKDAAEKVFSAPECRLSG